MVFFALLSVASIESSRAASTRFVECSDEFQRTFSALVSIEAAGTTLDGLSIDCRARTLVVNTAASSQQRSWQALASCEERCISAEARVAALLATELFKAESPRQLALLRPSVPERPPWAKNVRVASIVAVSVGPAAALFGTILLAVGVANNRGLGYEPNLINARGNAQILAGGLTTAFGLTMLAAGIAGISLTKSPRVTLTVTPGGLAAAGSF